MNMLAQDVIAAFTAKGLTLATVESCTGGMVAAALTDIPGSSAVVDRGYVTYSNAAKAEMVGVPLSLIAVHGAVSPEVATAMALGSLKHCKAEIAVSITGIAGPGGSDFKPEGLVCFCAAHRDGTLDNARIEFGTIGRENVRKKSVEQALKMMIELAEKPNQPKN